MSYVWGMKILLVSDYALPRGGNEVVTLALRDGLRARGHDVRLFSSRVYGTKDSRAPEYDCFGTSSRMRAALWCGNPFAYFGLRRALVDFRPDVVHVRLFLSQLSPLILPLLRDVPAIFHDGWYRTVCPIGSRVLPNGRECRETAGYVCYRSGCVPAFAWPLSMMQLGLWRRWRDAFDMFVANSRSVAEWLRASGIGHVEIIPNCVAPRGPRPPLADPPSIAFAGRLAYEKGVDTLLKAFKVVVEQRPDAKLLIAGEGPEGAKLRKMAEQFGEKVEFLGHQTRETIECRFNAAWVQVVPSRGTEAFGNAAAEAMMRGTAVVTSAIGGFPEYVEHERTGLLVPPDDEATLGATLLKILCDRGYAESLGQAGRRFALKAFDQGQFLNRFTAIYTELTRK